MKTKFIKKLSFVLVVAMVLSLLVPATGAFAASAKLNSTKKYLHLGREESGENEFNFNIKNKQKGWKYAWESNDEDVVEVNAKNGVVTATGVGKTKVTVLITDEDGEEVDTLSATVTVRDNIETVAVKNPVEKLTVNEEHDYNRSFETESGSTKKTSAITRWTVEPAEGASIDDKGVFVATEAGEYTVTALSFQSKARYDAWDDDAEKYADYVLATAETKVVVGASMVEAKQNDLDTITVTFDSAMVKADLEKNLKVSYVAGTTKVNHQVKGVSLDDAGKVATVDLYGDLIKDSTYVVDYEGMDSKEFKSATANYKDVVRAEILTKTAEVFEPEEIKFALYDVNNVNLAASFSDRVELETTSITTYLDPATKKLSMYTVGDTTTIKLTYHTYDYDLTNNIEIGAVFAEGIVACVEQKTSDAGLLNAYTVESGVTIDPDYSDAKHSIAKGDNNYLYVQLLGKGTDGKDLKTSSASADEAGNFKFTSSNENVLIINPDTGNVVGVSEGQAAVVVYYKDTYVGSAVITVVASRRATQIKLSTQSFTLSNHTQVQDVQDVSIEIKDQLGTDYGAFTVNTTLIGKAAGADGSLKTSADDATTISFNGAGVTKGNYTYSVEITDTNTQAKTTRIIYVNVAEPVNDDVHYYAIEANKSEFDTKVKDGDTSETATISIFGYSTNNVRNHRVDVANDANFTLNVKDPKNANYTILSGDLADDGAKNVTLELVDVDVDLLKAKPTGTYVLTATNASGKAVRSTYFAVKNTQDTASVVTKKLQTDKTVLLDAINDCFTFKVGGKDYAVAGTDYTVKTVGVDAKSVFIEKVKVYVPFDSYRLEYEINVNTTIRYNP